MSSTAKSFTRSSERIILHVCMHARITRPVHTPVLAQTLARPKLVAVASQICKQQRPGAPSDAHSGTYSASMRHCCTVRHCPAL